MLLWRILVFRSCYHEWGFLVSSYLKIAYSKHTIISSSKRGVDLSTAQTVARLSCYIWLSFNNGLLNVYPTSNNSPRVPSHHYVDLLRTACCLFLIIMSRGLSNPYSRFRCCCLLVIDHLNMSALSIQRVYTVRISGINRPTLWLLYGSPVLKSFKELISQLYHERAIWPFASVHELSVC